MKKIPVIGTAVLNSSYWVTRLMMSVDHPVENFVVINNGGDTLREDLDVLKKIRHKFIDNVRICHLPANIGVAGAWNLIIKSFAEAPYWIIANDDLSFGHGFLREMQEAAENDTEVGLVHGHAGDFEVGSWDVFLIRDSIVQKYGLFDENTYPAYNEDADYIMRLLNDMPKRVMSLSSNYLHGLGDKTQYGEHGSQTIKTDPSLREKIDRSNGMTMEYMNQKWGPGWRMCCPHAKPYNNPDLPLSYSNYDLFFNRKKMLD